MTKFIEKQIVFAPRQSETEDKAAEVHREMDGSKTTFYNRKKKHDGLNASELRCLQQLEMGNHQLEKLTEDLRLDKAGVAGCADQYPKQIRINSDPECIPRNLNSSLGVGLATKGSKANLLE